MNNDKSYSNKERLKNYFEDVIKGATLIAKISPRLTAIILISYVAQALLPLVSLLILKKCLDSVIPVEQIDKSEILLYFTLFIITNISNVLIIQYATFKQTVHQHVVSEYFATHVLNKAIKFDIEEYENPDFYNELHLVHQQTIYKPGMFLSVYQGVIQSIITIILLSGFLLSVHWLFPVLLISISIPLAINKLLYGYHQYLQDKSNIPLQRKASDWYIYLTTEPYAKEVRIFSFGQQFINNFLKARDIIFQQKKKLTLRFIKRTVFIQMLEAVILAGVYYFLVDSTVSGAITVGGLVIYIQMFQRFQSAINTLFQSGIGLFQHHLYLRNVIHYINKPLSQPKQVDNIHSIPAKWESIELKDLSFSYPNTDRKILNSINLTISSGEIVAIIGENGSGKSTLIKLLSRLYDTKENMLLLNGIDASKYSNEEWWDQCSVLFQDYGKYFLSVEENITFTNNSVQNKLNEVSEITGTNAIAQTLKEGYQTRLGRNYRSGVQLSGGQWQKIAITRSLYKTANLLILDEPTSSLDPISEYHLIGQIRESMNDDKMVVLVTHKLYNLKMVDKIVVMNDGEIVEQGSFDELMSLKGYFFRSYEKQLA